MKGLRKLLKGSRNSWLTLSILTVGVLFSLSLIGSNPVSANHPVLVEGNCDSPVPGTTIVDPGNCGDFDGDGRIGTAEDTDGADRVFGTLRAALGPGTGAAAGTGANGNGTIRIVTSGRFAEKLFIGQAGYVPGEGAASPGHVTIEAAPGVSADINAILQGDPAGGNLTRTTEIGIHVLHPGNEKRVILRNLTIRNWGTGIHLDENSRVTLDNCRLENNLDHGVRLVKGARVAAFNTHILATGNRTGIGSSAPGAGLGNGITFENNSAGQIYHSHITGSHGAGILHNSTGIVRYYELFYSHNVGGDTAGSGPFTRNNVP